MAGGVMEQPTIITEVQDRIAEMTGLLRRLSDQPEVIAELDAALEARDLDRFRGALELGGVKPPGDKCDPYVTVYVTMLRPAKFVRRCTWKIQSLQLSQGQQLAEAVAQGAEAEWLLERLIRLGLVECQWVREEQMDIFEAKRFVQGMCPPGTF
jgi:hypothetical protein